MEFDDILSKYIGDFGKFQILFYFFVTSISIHLAVSLLDYTFLGATPKYWCHVPDLNTYNFTRDEIAMYVSPPGDDVDCDACYMYVRDYANTSSVEIEEYIYTNHTMAQELEVTKCTDWTYDTSRYTSTVVTEWDLVCEHTWMIAMSQSVFMAGQFSVIVSGYLSDSLGRRPVAVVALVVHIVVRLITGFAVNYPMFVAGRLLTSIADIALYTAIYVFTVEIVGPKWRVLSGMSLYYFWLAGYVVLAGLAYFIRNWRILTLVSTALCLPYLVHICFLPESPRWLTAKGKKAQANKVLKRMAQVNGRWLPENLFVQDEKKADEGSASLIDLFKSWHFIKITLVFFFQWNVVTLVYYGLTFFIPSMGSNPYLSLLLSGLVEVPAVLYNQFTMDSRLGRRLNIIICFLVSGVLLLVILVIPSEYDTLRVGLAIFGKVGVSANFGFLYMMATEVYPTKLRNVGLSACSMSGRIGSVISPFISQLTVLHPFMPTIVMGVLAIIAASLGIFLPETRGQKLHDNVTEKHETLPGSEKEEEIHLKTSI